MRRGSDECFGSDGFILGINNCELLAMAEM
jgi:hypothetical protein